MERKLNQNNKKNTKQQIKDSSKKLTENERPIKSKGKYNLNFIDWNNEWERVNETILKIENGEEIQDKEEEKRIKYHINKEREKNGMKIKNFEIVPIPDTKIECYICLKNFTLKSRVRKLPCKHMFCEPCLLPWMKFNSKCPVCKAEFKKDLEEKGNYVISTNDYI